VIEDVGQGENELLLDVGRPADGPVADLAGKVLLGEAPDIGDDARILRRPRRAQASEVVKKDGIEPGGSVALAGQALHPDPVADQEMVERAMDRLEEGTVVARYAASGSSATAA
jgi:hypothetical protein